MKPEQIVMGTQIVYMKECGTYRFTWHLGNQRANHIAFLTLLSITELIMEFEFRENRRGRNKGLLYVFSIKVISKSLSMGDREQLVQSLHRKSCIKT